MKLIIAEKPSLARSIRDALKKDGEHFRSCSDNEYYKSESYYITSQYGHILELKMPEEYEENADEKYAPLPYFPVKYQFKVRDGCEKRYSTIRKLIRQEDVTEIIHCGDSDREGQLLVDLVLEQLKNTKPVTRPQFVALTPGAINSALARRKDNREYRLTRDEGFARMIFDFDYGINLSRYATRKSYARPPLNVGRVKGAILNELYLRDKAIKEFVPKKYYKAESDVNGIKLISEKDHDTEEEAAEYAGKLQAGETKVTDVATSPVTKKRPKLFSQTKLQSEMNKRYGYSPDRTLEYAQSLYEKGLTTYPRTNTEYMTDAETGTLEAIVRLLNQGGEEFKLRTDKSVIDNSKVDGHSAIIITGKRPENFSEGEMNCYRTVFNRFRAVFCKEECVYDKTTIRISNPLEDFKISGETLVQPGWQKFEKPEKKDKKENAVLPKVQTGEVLKTDFKAVEKTTTPPSRYTVTTLGSWMENPFRKEIKEMPGESGSDDEDYKNILQGLEIGTEATRAGILKTLQAKNYIRLNKSVYDIEERGIFLVEICRELGIDMSKERTAAMGKTIKDVGKGELLLRDAIESEHREIRSVIGMNRKCRQMTAAEAGFEGLTCPICGKPIRENSKAYGCSGWREGCRFTIWKEIAGKKLTKAQVKKLIQTGETGEISGFKSKKGTEFSARLKLSADKTKVEFDFAQGPEKSPGKSRRKKQR